MELSFEEFADLLQAKQLAANPGMGVQCVRDIAFYIRRGEIDAAKRVAIHDRDKIRSYKELEILVRDYLELPRSKYFTQLDDALDRDRDDNSIPKVRRKF